MAQMLSDPSTGVLSPVDDSSVLAIHSLLDSQVLSPSLTAENCIDDDDVFQCGRCKTQFTLITSFLNHKKVGCNLSGATSNNTVILEPQANASSIAQNTVLLKKIQLPSSPLSMGTQNVVLTETDLLSLAAAGLDQGITVNEPTINDCDLTTDSDNLGVNVSSLATELQSVVPQLQIHSPANLLDKNGEATLLNNKIITQLVLMRPPTDNCPNVSSVVLNIAKSGPTALNLTVQKYAREIEEVPPPPESIETSCTPNVAEKDLSTVNVITEFYRSMVKSKKKGGKSASEEEEKKDQKLSCAYCCKPFTKNFDLQQHIRCHTGEKPFQCIVCGRSFSQKSNVKKHMKTHKVWPEGLTNTLPSWQRDAEGLVEEKVQENQTPPLADSQENGDKSTERAYACPYCSQVCSSFPLFKSHMTKHEKKKVYKCILSTCGLMFSELDAFLEHAKTHESEMMYRCHECNKTYSSLYELGTHQYTHTLYTNRRSKTNKKYFRCSICLNRYSTPEALDHHINTTTHIYPCSTCSKTFSSERYLRRHMEIHADSQSHLCTLCNKGFKTLSYLKIHMLTHSRSKPFECSICKASFVRKDKLKRHFAIHETARRYKCPYRLLMGCTREFHRTDKLKQHIFSHGGLRKRPNNQTRKRVFQQEDNQKKNDVDRLEDDENLCDNSEILDDPSEASVHRPITRKKKRRNFALMHKGRNNQRSSRNNSQKAKKKEEEVGNILSDSENVDLIPTAHIEIISTDSQIVGENVSEISLTDLVGTTIENEFASAMDSSESHGLHSLALHPNDAEKCLL